MFPLFALIQVRSCETRFHLWLQIRSGNSQDQYGSESKFPNIIQPFSVSANVSLFLGLIFETDALSPRSKTVSTEVELIPIDMAICWIVRRL